ncbi:MAG: hypothetical protein QF785_02775 [Phycisphaeraceae bacterium]|nr:hypothetical protein [Phycisphaeraceae bacterium]MDP7347351.1 hypothetical protein [Phycisphaeraceae bacterium]
MPLGTAFTGILLLLPLALSPGGMAHVWRRALRKGKGDLAT